MEPLTVTVAGASGMIGLRRTSIFKLIAQGRLTTVRVNRRTLITVESLRALVGAGPASSPRQDRQLRTAGNAGDASEGQL